ncbi:DedA family protein [Galbitalea sp. SE-J8]|uniref:DedA family protein n=1 Tax=Galbitalea sp. SE-J8 TaxID=3054952 RepID=UPI00259D21F2|nr:DedA family protein [Galbitalea sp. SE-J8]MDM4761795.1 DedA family protein [Galbitalea sp. SE-J8]
MNELLDGLLGAVAGVDPALRALLAGLAILCETTVLLGLVVPGDTIVLVASTGVATLLQGVALFVAVLLGSLVGESLGFAIGRWFGHRLRRSRLGARIGEHTWQRAEVYLGRRGGVAVFVSRFLPVLHSIIPITVGMSEMPYRRFIRWTAPACAVWAALYVSVGAAAAGGYRELGDRLHWAGYGFAAVIVLFVVAVLVAKKLIDRAEKRHMHPENEG